MISRVPLVAHLIRKKGMHTLYIHVVTVKNT